MKPPLQTTRRDDFEIWLSDMDAPIQTLRADHPDLSGDPKSLPALEFIILSEFETVDAALAPANARRIDRLARYLGEVFRTTLGGKWDIELTDVKDAFFGLPVIKTPVGTYCPLTLVTATVDRRRGDYLEVTHRNALARRGSAQAIGKPNKSEA